MRCMNTFGLTIMITLQTSGTKKYLKNIYILWYYLLLLHVNAYAFAVHATQTTSKLLCSTRVNRFNLKIIVRNIKAKLILQNATRVFMFTKKTSFLCNLHVVTNKVDFYY